MSDLTPEKLDWIRRNSRVRLDREGRWSLDGRPVEHPRVQTLFHKGVSQDPDTGVAKLTVGTQWCYIEHLDDTAFFISRIRAEPHAIQLTLLDESRELLLPDTLQIAGPTDVYCLLQNGCRARFLRHALAQLGELLSERDGELILTIGTSAEARQISVG